MNFLARILKALNSSRTNQTLFQKETKHTFLMRFKMAIYRDGQEAAIQMVHQTQWAATTARRITELTTKQVAWLNGSRPTMTPTTIGLGFAEVGTLPIRNLISQLLQLAHLETRKVSYVRLKISEQASELSVYTLLRQSQRV